VKRIPIDRARDELTDLIRAAERGEPATITRWGKPVAEVVPVGTMARLVNTVPPSEP
jgi:prevent-host-death family protein